MNNGRLHLLIVDDEEAHAEAIRRAFVSSKVKADIPVARTLAEYRQHIANHLPDIALIDLNLPDGRAVDALTVPAESGSFPILVMTAFGNQEVVLEVLKAGALDYVVKSPASFSAMPETVKRVLREWKLLQQNKRIEDELRENETFLRESQKATCIGSYLLNIPGGWKTSDTMDELFGIDKTYGRSVEGWEALIHPDDRAMMVDYFKNEVLGKKQHFNKEYRIIRPSDGVERWVHGIGKLELDGEGCPVKMLGTIQDITGRKEGERTLRQLSQAVEQSPSAIVITDATGNIEYVNPKFTSLTGYSYEEVLGKNSRILKSGETPPEIYKELWDTITAGREWRGEFHNRKKDGELFWEHATIAPIMDKNGAITSFLAVKEDITDYKLLNEQFLRAQRIENIGSLASGIAHDLNNILSPIMMACSILADDLTAETHKKLVLTIQEAAQRGADIVKQVQIFARGKEGLKIQLEPELLVAQLKNMLIETFPKSIYVNFSIPEGLWTVSGDVTQLHQVLLNLCVNARDAMLPLGGTLTISVENIEVDKRRPAMMPDAKLGPHVLFKVIDTGCGIPAAIIDKIFDPFFTTKPLGKGTGLGLSTVMGIVKNHGGFTEIESQVGEGSIFRVFLPAVEKSQTESQQTEPSGLPQGHGETILIVDDEPKILDMVTMVLKKNGYTVLSSANGAEALATCVQHLELVKAVVTDVLMPVLDGVNLARALKKINPDMPVIAASGYIEQSQENALKELGVRAFLKKPFNNHELIEAVHSVVCRETARMDSKQSL